MIKIYISLTLRKLIKHKKYTIVNVIGLALGIACCIIILNYINNELTYDTYHPDHERIYRLEFYRDSFAGEFYTNSVSGPMGPLLQKECPHVESTARMIPPFENKKNVLVVNDQNRFFETEIYFADPEIMDILSFKFIAGNPEQALTEPFTVVISQSMAQKYFGNENPIGKILNIEIDYDYYCPVAHDDFIVSAVIEDTPPNTHIPVNMLISMQTMRTHLPWIDDYWMDHHAKYTYLKLTPNAEIAALNELLVVYADDYHERYKELTSREWSNYKLYLQPIRNIHMDSKVSNRITPAGNWYYIRIYSVIAAVVLLIGCMSFINISVSIGLKNIKQLGIRRIIGAKKSQLIEQCFIESLVFTAAAFLLSLGFVEVLQPIFNQIAGVQLNLTSLLKIPVIAAVAGLFILIVILNGSYNAFVLTGYKPYNVVKGNFNPGSKGFVMQKMLVFFQYVIIIILLSASFVIFQQLQFMRGGSLGFSKDHKIVIPFKSNLGRLRSDPENIKQEFLSCPEILGATVSSSVPGSQWGGYYMTRQDIIDASPEFLKVITTDFDFIDEFDLEFVAGRKFENESDQHTGYIINEAGAKVLGFSSPDEALGKELHAHYHGKIKTIIGVTKDFHYKGMQQEVEPLIIDIENSLYSTLTLSVRSEKLPQTLKFISTKWEELFPGTPYSYSFLDEDFDMQYKQESHAAHMISIISLAGIIIASTGLLGMVSFFVAQKTKEIGIRKVLGSSVTQIVHLFSHKFIKTIILTMIVAIPICWIIMSMWLKNFAYRIDLTFFPFLLASVIVLFITSLVVTIKCVTASNANPVEALKYE